MYNIVRYVFLTTDAQVQKLKWGISKLQRNLPTAQVLLGENLQEEEELFKNMQTQCENLQANYTNDLKTRRYFT